MKRALEFLVASPDALLQFGNGALGSDLWGRGACFLTR
jgi:hypothetical protein